MHTHLCHLRGVGVSAENTGTFQADCGTGRRRQGWSPHRFTHLEHLPWSSLAHQTLYFCQHRVTGSLAVRLIHRKRVPSCVLDAEALKSLDGQEGNEMFLLVSVTPKVSLATPPAFPQSHPRLSFILFRHPSRGLEG